MAKIDLGDGAKFSGGIHWTKDEWINWCWERNQQARERGWSRWLFVKDTDTGLKVEQLGGDDAKEIWDMIEDRPYIPYRWTEVNIRKLVGRVQWFISRGMASDAFMLWSAEHRAQKRKAIIDREIEASRQALSRGAA